MDYAKIMIDAQFMIHNSHLDDPRNFANMDPQLRMLNKQTYVYSPPLLKLLPETIPGIYSISGGRQIGKTTFLKQWMQRLLTNGINPKSIAYFTGEIIVDHLSLIRQLQAYLQIMPQNTLRYIIIDEVTYIQNWDMGVKFLADAGLLSDVILVITGSDLVIIQEARMRFPGRRGRSKQVDFHIHPLSFYEMLKLTDRINNLDEQLQKDAANPSFINKTHQQFLRYLIHGGYLTALNNFAEHNEIDKPILDTYADWVRGDVIKHGKTDHHCREFLTAMLKRLNSQITWNALAKDFSIEHHATVAEYAELLMSMDAIYIQQALQEDKLVGAAKKARKLIFTDPFIYHAIRSWIEPCRNPFLEQITVALNDPITTSYLVEACVTSHYRRWFPTYYIKAEGEVDVAYIHKNRFWPVEIKWTQQVRECDLKQIQKYKNGIILGKQTEVGKINHTSYYPLPWYLARLGYIHSQET